MRSVKISTPVVWTLWLLASICFVVALPVAEAPIKQIAILGYVVLQGAVIFLPRRREE